MTPDHDDRQRLDVEHQLLLQLVEDRDSGRVRDLAEYQALFPGHEEFVASVVSQMSEDSPQVDRDRDARFEGRERIGTYRLLEEVGRGGQGVVFRAHDERLDRRVALKVLGRQQGTVHADSLARFRREAEAAARLEHPGICPVYECGEDDGIHYIAMRFVQGETLAHRIARAVEAGGESALFTADLASSASSRERSRSDDRSDLARTLRFVERAAAALHHAHEHGVVHRDVKPGNIMISPEEEPIVLDFGLARDDESLLATLTETGDVLGSPAYMAPEQVKDLGRRPDRRTDVYGLGVVLFEALTLRRPFQAPRRADLFDAILHRAPPSVTSLQPRLPRDLDVILQVALEKDPQRRYDTAADLAEDLRRVRQLEPILARPVGRMVHLQRWAQRNRGVAVSLAFLFLSLTIGFVVSLSQFLTARAAGRAEAEARGAAEEAAAEATAINEFLLDDLLAAAHPDRAQNREITMLEVLDLAAERVRERFADRPGLEVSIRSTLGRTYNGLGAYEQAFGQFDRAYELARVNGTEDEILELDHRRAATLVNAGRMDEAASAWESVVVRSRQIRGPEHRSTLRAMNSLAYALTELGREQEAETLFHDTLAIQRRTLGDEDEDTLTTINNYTGLLYDRRDFEKAEPLYREVLAGRRRLFGDDHPKTLTALNNLATVLANTGRYEEAADAFQKALDGQRRALGPEHDVTVGSIGNLAVMYQMTGKDLEAADLMRTQLEIVRRNSGEDHWRTAVALGNLGRLLLKLRQLDEAEELLEQRLELSERVDGEDHRDTWRALSYVVELRMVQQRFDEALELNQRLRRLIGRSEKDVAAPRALALPQSARILAGLDRLDEAEALLQEVIAEQEAALGAEHGKTISNRILLARLLVEGGRLEDAEHQLDRVRQTIESAPDGPHPSREALDEVSARLWFARGDHAAAEPILRRQVERWRDQEMERLWFAGEAMAWHGRCLLGLGRDEEAEALLLDARRILDNCVGPRAPETIVATEALIDLYVRTHRGAEAAHWRARLAEE